MPINRYDIKKKIYDLNSAALFPRNNEKEADFLFRIKNIAYQNSYTLPQKDKQKILSKSLQVVANRFDILPVWVPVEVTNDISWLFTLGYCEATIDNEGAFDTLEHIKIVIHDRIFSSYILGLFHYSPENLLEHELVHVGRALYEDEFDEAFPYWGSTTSYIRSIIGAGSGYPWIFILWCGILISFVCIIMFSNIIWGSMIISLSLFFYLLRGAYLLYILDKCANNIEEHLSKKSDKYSVVYRLSASEIFLIARNPSAAEKIMRCGSSIRDRLLQAVYGKYGNQDGKGSNNC